MFIKQCFLINWLVTPVNVENRIDIYNIAEEEIEFDEETGEMVRKDTDVAPYVGVGRILTKIVNGVYKYKVEFLPKVKFAEPSQEETTKGDSIEFKTPNIEGTVTKLTDGTWSKSKTFTSKEEAVAYLDDLMKKNI